MFTLSNAMAKLRLIALLAVLIVACAMVTAGVGHPVRAVADGFGWGRPDPGTIR